MKECGCVEFCARWGEGYSKEHGHYGWYAPYVPGGGTTCKHTLYDNMKPTIHEEDKK